MIGLVDRSSNKMVAFTRVLTDYFRFAYIYDVIVHGDYRAHGLGKMIINLVLNHKDIKSIKNVELVCRKDRMSFYKQFGFSEDYGASIPMRRQIV